MARTDLTLLLTRPERQSRRFADEFRAQFPGVAQVVIAPLMEITALPARWPERVTGAIFTSENAVRSAPPARPGLPAWCVGARTAAAAAEIGYEARPGSGDARALARMIIEADPAGPLACAQGAHQAYDISETLNSAGIETISMLVYDQQTRPLLPNVKALLRGSAPILLPLFSPRSAKLLAEAVREPAAPLYVAAMSDAVRKAWVGHPSRAMDTAARPDAAAMLAALGRLIAAARAA